MGADARTHGATDCLGLAIAVLRFYGVTTPQPKRSWYRRLKRGDTEVFRDELERWGIEVEAPRLGAVGLCRSELGYGLAVWWSEGWLSYRLDQVAWSPPGVLEVCGIYCRSK